MRTREQCKWKKREVGFNEKGWNRACAIPPGSVVPYHHTLQAFWRTIGASDLQDHAFWNSGMGELLPSRARHGGDFGLSAQPCCKLTLGLRLRDLVH